MPLDAPERALKNLSKGGPNVVVPDYLRKLILADVDSGQIDSFSNSVLGEVKAVAGNLTPGYRQWQILGLLDAARRSPVTKAPLDPPPPPVLEFVTTGNTVVPVSTIQQATL
jgi:hypothetical protein